MRKKMAIVLSAAMIAAALSVPATAAQGGTSDSMINYLNVLIMPIDDNYSSTNFIQATFTPDNSGEEALRSQSCSGTVAATNFLSVPSGTVTFNKSGYHTEPASWHVNADHFDGQTLQFTLIPDNYTGDPRAAAMPEVSITKTDRDEQRNLITPQDLLTLSTSTPDAVIHYTTDGSDPTYESARYTRPIYLEGDVTFKAIATKGGYVKSPVMEYQYKAEIPAERPKMQTTRISGSIVDEAGNPIPYVRITYTFEIPTSATGTVTAGEENGEFFVDEYDRDIGTLKFSKEGYTFENVKITETYDGSPISVVGKSKTAPKETVSETTAPEETIPEETVSETTISEDNDSDEVIVYQDKNYRGKSLALTEGKYKMSQLSKVGNDAISSLKVPEGYTVTLYEHDNFKGKSLVCNSDNPWLGTNKFNDKTSSIIITKN